MTTDPDALNPVHRNPAPTSTAEQADELVRMLTLHQTEDYIFADPSVHAGTERENQRTFGGQVLAQALMAASRTVGEDRSCHSFHCYFLRPGSNAKPITYKVEGTRDARSFSQRRVNAYQDEKLMFTLTSSHHITESGFEHSDKVPGGTPGPEDCPTMAEVLRDRFGGGAEQWIAWRGLDVRYAGDSGSVGSDSHSSHMRVWVRVAAELPDDVRLHQSLAAYISDLTILSVATIPHQVPILAPNLQAASVDHAMWFHRPIKADQWLLHDQISPSASAARGFSSGRIFQHGAMASSVCQEGLLRLVDEPVANRAL
ncbi:acyl-CoA thioesterase II [Aestuariimicrobium sp. p3-SID1156]|uniref:acyl-CoA thioesterase n=1 Tax=Aestuariimicrobium sp. p3-SID1156 TaxID=2916038 RepID=UPI00223ADEAB|nr:acyl-CoA thioesterase II [Aestuariimicrobium sp. p3-SID1156]MCT1459060.1 acyl-CoA thioesterase II [Aestuariimicrobium sp. p3-SID1156]